MGKIVLFTGGARSGKSRLAEEYAAACGKVLYVATAQVLDDEMRQRVALHQRRRPAAWGSVEAWRDPAAVLLEHRASECILFDCLSMYVTNLLLSEAAPQDSVERGVYMRREFDLLIAEAQKIEGTLIFVTNEVGMGIVPENALAREYRDLAGLLNQEIAALATEVYLAVSGLAVNVKKLAEVSFKAEG